jgi:protein TonB
MAIRHFAAAGLSVGVTFGLFYLMQALISMEGRGLDDRNLGQIIEFVRLKREPELELKKRELPDKKPPPEKPPPPDMDLSNAMAEQSLGGIGVGLEVDVAIAGGPNIGATASDTDAIPIVRVAPQYPMRAAERGIQGWVELGFTISVAGTVKDPVVLASHPGSIFNKEALRAIRKWKYNPKIVNGEPVERTGLKVRLKFELEGE